jgi:hypothetical protein
MAEGFLIGQGVRDKLRETFRDVDAIMAGTATPTTLLRTNFDEPPPQQNFRIGSYGTAAWAVDTTATVTLLNVGITGYTVAVSNVFGSVATAASSRQVAIARDGTAWYLIQARCP